MNAQNFEVVSDKIEGQPKDVWQAPILIHVEIKRTLFAPGYNTDSHSGSTS